MAADKQQEQAFLLAYEQYADSIFRYCLYKTSNRELAKDLAQQTFLKVWSYLRDGNRVNEFRPFLYRSANNLIIDWYRRHKADSLDVLMESGFEPQTTQPDPARLAESSWALAVMKQLSEADQQLITWRYLEDMSAKEMAKILGERENNISVRLHRAIGRLKKLLTDEHDQ